MPPWKPWDENEVGTYVQDNYEFVDRLFGPQGAAIRKKFWACTTETQLRKAIKDEAKINVPASVRVGVFDVEAAALKVIKKIDPKTEDFYIMVMPPKPRRKNTADYKDGQAWEEAWFHAIVDGYGI
jgi:hypothetical protein